MAIFMHHGGAYRVGLTADITVSFNQAGPGPGYLQTEDMHVIQSLRDSSYLRSGVIEEIPEQESDNQSNGTLKLNELRKIAKEQGIPDFMKKSKSELVNLLATR